MDKEEEDDVDNDALKMVIFYFNDGDIDNDDDFTSFTYSLPQMSVRTARRLGSMWSSSRRKSARRFSQMMTRMMMMFVHCDHINSDERGKKVMIRTRRTI